MRHRLCSCLLLLVFAGCDSLSEYRGTFGGNIISGSFVRSCFPAEARAELRFDPAKATGQADSLPDVQRNWLTVTSQQGEEVQVLLDAPLDPIRLLANDTLADLDFPGPRRLKSYMLNARPKQGPLAGRDALIVVSLLDDKQVELRVMGRGEENGECPGEVESEDETTSRIPEFYGFFRLK